jgi:hypothetical protein
MYSWPRIWWNLNIQTLYLPCYTGNRLLLGESFVNLIDQRRDNFRKIAKDIWNCDNGAGVSHNTDNQGMRGDGSLSPARYLNPADFGWALHDYYRHYRHSMDHALITDQQKHAFYQMLKENVNLFHHLLKKGEDGKLHLPKLHSPEHGDDEDNNYNVSVLRWGCQTLLALNKRYQFNGLMAPVWEQTFKDLVPYPVDENRLRIGVTMSFTKSHRHWSHMLMVHPLHTMNG